MSEAIEDVRTLVERGVAIWAEAKVAGTLEAVLDALYRHEINVGLQSFWDGGWEVWIGDDMNGHRAECNFTGDEIDEIVPWLIDCADKMYPGLRGDA